MEITFLGTGTSTGVPAIGCTCPVCTSRDPRDTRARSSVLVTGGEGTRIVIDTGPDFRAQCLRFGITAIDAVLYTHAHMDHVAGLDDLRRFNTLSRAPLKVYALPPVLAQIRQSFAYAFADAFRPDIPSLLPVELAYHRTHRIGEVSFTPLPLHHGSGESTCFMFGSWAYATDTSGIPPETAEHLDGVPLLVLGALRVDPHPKHFSFREAGEKALELAAKKVYYTHLGHDVRHADARSVTGYPHIGFAYDGLVLTPPPRR